LKACKKPQQEARVLCQMGHIYLLQGANMFDKALKAFRDATKRDAGNVKVLLGMVLCQLCEGAVDDAEAQIELLTLMHSVEDLGYELLYLQAQIQKSKKGGKKDHYATLQACYEGFLNWQQSSAPDFIALEIGGYSAAYLNAFGSILKVNPDFSMSLAIDFFGHMESSVNMSSFTPSSTSSASFLNLNNEEDDTDDSDNRLKGSLIEADDMQNSLTKLEVSPAMQMGAKLLQSVLSICPGCLHAYLELSRAYFSMSLQDEAIRALSQALSMQPQSSVVLVSMALLEAGRQKTQAADRLLEQALACDFSIRSMPKFKMVKSIVRAQQGRYSEAIAEVEQVLTLPDFGFSLATEKDSGAGDLTLPVAASSSSYSDTFRLTDDDKVLCCVVYASILSKEHRMKEAQKALSQAKVMFAGSAQEVQVLVASAQLYVDRGDYDAAVRMLDKIGAENSAFARAQILKADILLNNNHDREGYTKCFQQLAEREPSARNFVLLGDSYLRILNPEAAIDSLEKAYKLEPRNSRLRAKIGRALVSTHEYHRAVEFYEAALRELNSRLASTSNDAKNKSTVDAASAERISLAHDLAKLYMKLGRHESADRVLNNIIHDTPGALAEHMSNIQTYTLLVQVYRQHSTVDVIPTLQKIYGIYKGLNSQMRSGMSFHSDIEENKIKLAAICNEIAKEMFDAILHNAPNHSIDDVERYLQEGNNVYNQSTDIMLSLAKMFKYRRTYEQCQVQCHKIVSINTTNVKEALLLLADVLLLVSDAEKAVEPIMTYLNSNPSVQYDLLERCITLLRRAGKLVEAKNILANIEKRDKKHLSQAGYHYCNGLYLRYTNNIGKAILEFNYCRRDEAWAAQAITHMVELYLNPDQDGIWEVGYSVP
ncbi:tetratricopeptide repeat protein, partial [archaeon]